MILGLMEPSHLTFTGQHAPNYITSSIRSSPMVRNAVPAVPNVLHVHSSIAERLDHLHGRNATYVLRDHKFTVPYDLAAGQLASCVSLLCAHMASLEHLHGPSHPDTSERGCASPRDRRTWLLSWYFILVQAEVGSTGLLVLATPSFTPSSTSTRCEYLVDLIIQHIQPISNLILTYFYRSYLFLLISTVAILHNSNHLRYLLSLSFSASRTIRYLGSGQQTFQVTHALQSPHESPLDESTCDPGLRPHCTLRSISIGMHSDPSSASTICTP